MYFNFIYFHVPIQFRVFLFRSVFYLAPLTVRCSLLTAHIQTSCTVYTVYAKIVSHEIFSTFQVINSNIWSNSVTCTVDMVVFSTLQWMANHFFFHLFLFIKRIGQIHGRENKFSTLYSTLTYVVQALFSLFIRIHFSCMFNKRYGFSYNIIYGHRVEFLRLPFYANNKFGCVCMTCFRSRTSFMFYAWFRINLMFLSCVVSFGKSEIWIRNKYIHINSNSLLHWTIESILAGEFICPSFTNRATICFRFFN